ncbi:thymidine phosphorylase family protein [bacterium]|nr:thymidine phosphorylase family protein [bacterium]
MNNTNCLHIKRLGIDTYQDSVVYIRASSGVCRSEGFEAHTQVKLSAQGKSIVATLNVVHDHLFQEDEIGFSEAAFKRMGLPENTLVAISHAEQASSMAYVRGKVYGNKLSSPAMHAIVADIVGGKYTDIQLSSFITACATGNLDIDEITHLTRAMIDTGETVSWESPIVVDKHSVGGLPGNRITPIVVSLVTCHGLTMPKTSSRAITSPSGTADTMEVITPINLDTKKMKQVVHDTGGCFIWGGHVRFSPADDILIRVERVLDLDSEGQMIASVLSKKKAAGSTHVVIDMPLGPTAKVRDMQTARLLERFFIDVGLKIGLTVEVIITDGVEPVGYGIGPALEAHDILAVLQNHNNAPADLTEKSLVFAGKILEMAKVCLKGEGIEVCRNTLKSGKAFQKFIKICNEQGGFCPPAIAPIQHPVLATASGTLTAFNNRKLAMIAKLAGAPKAPLAGVKLHKKLGDIVEKNDVLYTLHSETPGELAYVLSYIQTNESVVTITP